MPAPNGPVPSQPSTLPPTIVPNSLGRPGMIAPPANTIPGAKKKDDGKGVVQVGGILGRLK
jgi:hypothetical protein